MGFRVWNVLILALAFPWSCFVGKNKRHVQLQKLTFLTIRSLYVRVRLCNNLEFLGDINMRLHEVARL